MQKDDIVKLLNNHQMRATKNRIQVLLFVEMQHCPVGIGVLRKQFPAINEVTLYRMASDFVEKGIWRAFDLGRGCLEYESANRPHHHHAVCESCGTIEEVYSCESECKLIHLFEGKVKQFTSLKTPSATVFGTCVNCTDA